MLINYMYPPKCHTVSIIPLSIKKNTERYLMKPPFPKKKTLKKDKNKKSDLNFKFPPVRHN